MANENETTTTTSFGKEKVKAFYNELEEYKFNGRKATDSSEWETVSCNLIGAETVDYLEVSNGAEFNLDNLIKITDVVVIPLDVVPKGNSEKNEDDEPSK